MVENIFFFFFFQTVRTSYYEDRDRCQITFDNEGKPKIGWTRQNIICRMLKAHLKFNMFMRRIAAIRRIIITAITTKAMIIHSFYVRNRQTIEFTELYQTFFLLNFFFTYIVRTYVVCIPYEQRNNKLKPFRFVVQLMVWFIAHLQPLFVHVDVNGLLFTLEKWNEKNIHRCLDRSA